MKKCVFAGTFDPFTVGHADTVEKCLKLFDEVTIAVAENKNKSCMFSAEERKEMIEGVFFDQPRVKVLVWQDVIVRLLQRENTPFYIRGIRNETDLAYENADFYASRDLDPDMITIYLPSEREHLHVSSSLVKRCIAFHVPYEKYVPPFVYEFIKNKEK